MTDEIRQIAARIREMREISGFKPEDIAGELNIPIETWLSYENEGMDIPISVLYRLSHKFKVDLNELLTGKTPRLDDYCVVRAGEGQSTKRYEGYSYKSLAHKFAHRMMEPLMVTVESSDHPPALVSHPGQEFNIVMEGQIKVIFEGHEIVLSTGDSIYFDPRLPHGQTAVEGKAKFLTVIAE